MVFWPVSVSGSAVALLIVDRNSSEKAILPWNSPGSSSKSRMKKKERARTKRRLRNAGTVAQDFKDAASYSSLLFLTARSEGANSSFWAEQRYRAAVCLLAPSFASFEGVERRLIDLRRGAVGLLLGVSACTWDACRLGGRYRSI